MFSAIFRNSNTPSTETWGDFEHLFEMDEFYTLPIYTTFKEEDMIIFDQANNKVLIHIDDNVYKARPAFPNLYQVLKVKLCKRRSDWISIDKAHQ
jgi:hypothetical protein